MSRRSWNLHDRPFRGIYRDTENGWFFGVCAGLAEFGNLRTGTVRVITAICLFFFFWPVVLAYAAAVFLLRERPLIYRGGDAENRFWRRRSDDDTWSRS